MKRFILLLVAGILFMGCGYNYLSYRHRKQFRDSKSEVTLNQISQLRVLDSAKFSRGAHVYIRPIMVNRNHVGVYGYNRNSSHFGRVYFFEYKNDSVILISRNNEDSLRNEVERFLNEHDFSKRKIAVAMKRLKSTYDILSTDSF